MLVLSQGPDESHEESEIGEVEVKVTILLIIESLKNQRSESVVVYVLKKQTSKYIFQKCHL